MKLASAYVVMCMLFRSKEGMLMERGSICACFITYLALTMSETLGMFHIGTKLADIKTKICFGHSWYPVELTYHSFELCSFSFCHRFSVLAAFCYPQKPYKSGWNFFGWLEYCDSCLSKIPMSTKEDERPPNFEAILLGRDNFRTWIVWFIQTGYNPHGI